MGKLTKLAQGWTYERQGSNSDSKQKDRALFLKTIPELKPQVLTSLYFTAFLGFCKFVTNRFRRYLLKIPLPPNPSHSDFFSWVWNVPEKRVRRITIGGWGALKRNENAKELCVQLQEWAQAQNLTADWCLDHAIEVLREWLYDERVRWLDVMPQRILIEITPGWKSAIIDIEFELVFSRASLFADTHSTDLVDPPSFVFEREGLRFEAVGWNYLQKGKKEWKEEIEQEFDEFKDQRKAGNQSVPKGSLTALRQELAKYIKKQDAKKRAAVKQHGLVRRSRSYAQHRTEDHLKWLIMYQVPPCQKYAEIVSLSGNSIETVRKYVVASAKHIGLPLRDKSLHAGSPTGKTHRSPHRARR